MNVWGEENIGKSLYLLFNFAVNLIFLQKIRSNKLFKHIFIIWPNNSVSRYFSREIKSYVFRKTGLWVFTPVFFIITPNRKQFSCLSMCHWLNKLENARNGILLTNKKWNTILRIIWMNQKFILLSERSQFQYIANFITPFIQCSGKGKNIEILKISLVSQG